METSTPPELPAQLAGQVSALGIAVQVMLQLHPRRDEAAALIHERLEALFATSMRIPGPQAEHFRQGLERIRDGFLLKWPDDPASRQQP